MYKYKYSLFKFWLFISVYTLSYILNFNMILRKSYWGFLKKSQKKIMVYNVHHYKNKKLYLLIPVGYEKFKIWFEKRYHTITR